MTTNEKHNQAEKPKVDKAIIAQQIADKEKALADKKIVKK